MPPKGTYPPSSPFSANSTKSDNHTASKFDTKTFASGLGLGVGLSLIGVGIGLFVAGRRLKSRTSRSESHCHLKQSTCSCAGHSNAKPTCAPQSLTVSYRILVLETDKSLVASENKNEVVAAPVPTTTPTAATTAVENKAEAIAAPTSIAAAPIGIVVSAVVESIIPTSTSIVPTDETKSEMPKIMDNDAKVPQQVLYSSDPSIHQDPTVANNFISLSRLALLKSRIDADEDREGQICGGH